MLSKSFIIITLHSYLHSQDILFLQFTIQTIWSTNITSVWINDERQSNYNWKKKCSHNVILIDIVIFLHKLNQFEWNWFQGIQINICTDQEGLTTVLLRGQVTFVFPGGLAAVKFQSHANPDIPWLRMNSHVARVKWRKNTIRVGTITIFVALKNLQRKPWYQKRYDLEKRTCTWL